MHIIGVSEGEERERGLEKIFEKITAGNFPNMRKETVNHVQEVQSTRQDILRRDTLKHTVIKLTKIKDKDKILKATREKDRQHTRETS